MERKIIKFDVVSCLLLSGLIYKLAVQTNKIVIVMLLYLASCVHEQKAHGQAVVVVDIGVASTCKHIL